VAQNTETARSVEQETTDIPSINYLCCDLVPNPVNPKIIPTIYVEMQNKMLLSDQSALCAHTKYLIHNRDTPTYTSNAWPEQGTTYTIHDIT